jgi:hypothetical protein
MFLCTDTAHAVALAYLWLAIGAAFGGVIAGFICWHHGADFMRTKTNAEWLAGAPRPFGPFRRIK